MEYVVVMTTTGTADEANRIAEELVRRKLAACVQVVGPVRSVYRWQGKIESSEEYRCEIKSVSAHLEEIRQLVCELHSYDLPELIALPITYASPAYADWLEEQVGVDGNAST